MHKIIGFYIHNSLSLSFALTLQCVFWHKQKGKRKIFVQEKKVSHEKIAPLVIVAALFLLLSIQIHPQTSHFTFFFLSRFLIHMLDWQELLCCESLCVCVSLFCLSVNTKIKKNMNRHQQQPETFPPPYIFAFLFLFLLCERQNQIYIRSSMALLWIRKEERRIKISVKSQ